MIWTKKHLINSKHMFALVFIQNNNSLAPVNMPSAKYHISLNCPAQDTVPPQEPVAANFVFLTAPPKKKSDENHPGCCFPTHLNHLSSTSSGSSPVEPRIVFVRPTTPL